MTKLSHVDTPQRAAKRTPKLTPRAQALAMTRKASRTVLRRNIKPVTAIDRPSTVHKPTRSLRRPPSPIARPADNKNMKPNAPKRQASGTSSRPSKTPRLNNTSRVPSVTSRSFSVSRNGSAKKKSGVTSTKPFSVHPDTNEQTNMKKLNTLSSAGLRSGNSFLAPTGRHVSGKGVTRQQAAGKNDLPGNAEVKICDRSKKFPLPSASHTGDCNKPSEKIVQTKSTDKCVDPALPAFPEEPLYKGNQAFSVTSEVYLVRIALLAIEKRIRGNVNFGHELRFNPSEVSRLMHKTDERFETLVSNNQAGLAKVQRFLRKLGTVNAKWLRGGLPETASVKNPETIKTRQGTLAKQAVKNTSFSVSDYEEHIERVGLLCGHMGSYRPEFGVTTVGAVDPSVKRSDKNARNRASTYEIDEISSGSEEPDGVDALREVESDTDDDGGSPSGGPKRKSVREGLVEDDISIVPMRGIDKQKGCNAAPEANVGSGNAAQKKTGTVKEAPKCTRNDAASGRGKRSIPPIGTLPALEKFVEMIGESTKAQNAREERRIQLELKKSKEEHLLKRLDKAQKLVNENPGNAVFENMLEQLARKVFTEDSD